MKPVLLLTIAYLLGSIPFGYLIVRAKEGVDVRASGSGATGATNVTRRAGKLAGALTLVLDAVKGALAVLLARKFLADDFGINFWVAAVAVAAIVGHIFPVWLKFRGGKGVATGVGAFLCLSPLAVLFASLLFLLVVISTRFVSLGSITAAAALPVIVWLIAYSKPSRDFVPTLAASIAGSVLIIFMHRANIGRLLNGTESRFR